MLLDFFLSIPELSDIGGSFSYMQRQKGSYSYMDTIVVTRG